jgi:tyrosinase
VQAAAEEYEVTEGRDDYIQAAKTFRLPYWDWALPPDQDNGVFPGDALTGVEHDIHFPDSRKVKKFARNPLASYKFGSVGMGDVTINKVSVILQFWPCINFFLVYLLKLRHM